MKTVWITRTEPGASQQADVLRAHGHAVLVWPLLDIALLDPPQVRVNGNRVDDPDRVANLRSASPCMVIALSAHAVRAAAGHCVLHEAADAIAVAVGAQTAALLSLHFADVAAPTEATSEGILALPEVTRLAAGDTVWVLAGVGGRDLLEQQLLSQHGVTVVKFEFYRRVDQTRPPDLDARSIGAVVIASQQGLNVFTKQWQNMSGSLSVPLIVPSDRVAAAATEAGFLHVHVAGGADVHAVLAALQDITTYD
jgi:uroporphyrinogen-III synthase